MGKEFMRVIMEFLVPVLAVLLVITQILMPMVIPSMKFFWIFSRGERQRVMGNGDIPLTEKPETKKTGLDEVVDEVANELTKDAAKLKSTTGKVDETIEKLTSAKNNSLNDLNDHQNKNQ